MKTVKDNCRGISVFFSLLFFLSYVARSKFWKVSKDLDSWLPHLPQRHYDRIMTKAKLEAETDYGIIFVRVYLNLLYTYRQALVEFETRLFVCCWKLFHFNGRVFWREFLFCCLFLTPNGEL